jgi:hypothetical protein
VWATWRRLSLVDEFRRALLYDAIRRKAIALCSHVIAVGGTRDHVHLLARVHPCLSVARLVDLELVESTFDT